MNLRIYPVGSVFNTRNLSKHRNIVNNYKTPSLGADYVTFGYKKQEDKNSIVENAKTNPKSNTLVDISGVLKAVKEGETEAKNAAKNVLGEVAALKREGDKVYAKLCNSYKEVAELFQKGDEITDDNKILRIINDNEMKEFDNDGKTLLRRTKFTSKGVPSLIEEFTEDGKRNILTLNSYKGGCEKLPDGSTKIEREMNFENGSLSGYENDIEISPEGYIKKIGKIMRFWDDNLYVYKENYQITNNKRTIKIDKEMMFKKGELCDYEEGYESTSFGILKKAKKIEFENGNTRHYLENLEFDTQAGISCKDRKVKKDIWFDRGKITKCQLDLETNNED